MYLSSLQLLPNKWSADIIFNIHLHINITNYYNKPAIEA